MFEGYLKTDFPVSKIRKGVRRGARRRKSKFSFERQVNGYKLLNLDLEPCLGLQWASVLDHLIQQIESAL